MEDIVSKELFIEKYNKYYEEQPGKRPYTSAQLKEIADEIVTAINKKALTKTRREYYLLRKYDIITVDNNVLVVKKSEKRDKLIYLTPEEDVFDRLLDIHVNCGHGSRDKMMDIIKQSCSIPRPCVELFLKCCKTCQMKKSRTVAKVVVKPILTKSFMARGQVDLIDFQSIPDGKYRWLLNYQDHATKYLCLRPLKAKQAADVANELIKIFLQFGAPAILQSDNGREFVNKVIEEFKVLWPQLHIVHGRPRHPQSQGSVERANQDVENMLRAWMTDNHSTSWATGCYFVQWQKNNSLHRVIGRSPFKAVFGSDPKLGLASTNLPQHILSSVATEEELNNLKIEINCNGLAVDSNEDELNLADADAIIISNDVINNNNNNNLNNNNNVSTDLSDSIEAAAIEVTTPEECVVCQKNVSDQNYRCQTCAMPIHLSCMGKNGLCHLCISAKNIDCNQVQSYNGIKTQAEKMLTVTKKILPDITVGDCVLVNVDKVDRSPGDPQNIVAVITNFENEVYQVGTVTGLIKSWFNKCDLKKASSNFLKIEQVNSNTFISLREAVAAQSLFKGQGFVKCSCQPSKTQCQTNRCLCFKSKLQCNSRCHKSGPCANK